MGRFGYELSADVQARGDIVAGLVLSGAAGAEGERQKSVIIGVRAGCRAVDGDIVAGGGWAVWLVLSGVAGAENGRQKSVIVGVRAGC